MKQWLQTARYRLGQVYQQLGFVEPLTLTEYDEVAHWLPAAAQVLFKSMSPADQRHSLRVCRGLQAVDCTDEDMLAAALLHDVGKAQGRVPFWTRPIIVMGKKLAPEVLKRLVVEPDICISETDVETGGGDEVDVDARALCLSETDCGAGVGTGSGDEADEGASCLSSSSGRHTIPTGTSTRPPRPHPHPPLVPTLFHRLRRSLSYAWYHAEVGARLAAEAGLSEQAVLYIRMHHQSRGPAALLHEIDEVS